MKTATVASGGFQVIKYKQGRAKVGAIQPIKRLRTAKDKTKTKLQKLARKVNRK